MIAVIIALLVLCINPLPAAAESILLKSGRIIEGELLEKTDEYIKIDTETGVKKIRFSHMDKDFAEAYKSLPEQIMKETTPRELYKGRTLEKEDINAQDILEKVTKEYRSMQAFQSSVVGLANTDRGGYVTTAQKFINIKLQRPSYYLVKEQVTRAGKPEEIRAAWNNGTPHYYHSERKTITQFPSDALALMNVNYAKVLHNLFFGCKSECHLLKDLQYIGNAVLNREDCYLLQRKLKAGTYTLWISKEQNIVIRIDYDYEGQEEEFFARSFSLNDIKNVVVSIGLEASGTNQKKLRAYLKNKFRIRWGLKLKGYAELIMDNILIDQEQDPDTFKIGMPAGTTLLELEAFADEYERITTPPPQKKRRR